MLSIQETFTGIKSKAEKILGLDKKSELALLTRDRVEDLVNGFLKYYSIDQLNGNEALFYQNEAQLRQDVIRRLRRILPDHILEDSNWLDVQNLFEKFFSKGGLLVKGDDEEVYKDLAERMEYSVDLLKKIMYCVGRSQRLGIKTSGVNTVDKVKK